MQLPDLVNGLFQGLPFLFELLNIRAILRDKKVRGFSLMNTAFFELWCLWSLFYFNNLGQTWSVIGSFATGCAGTCYVFLAFYYVHLERHRKSENKKVLFFGALSAIIAGRSLGALAVYAGALYGNQHRWTDMLNSLFELGGGVFVLVNCLVLIRDEEFKGGSFAGRIFYTSWGAWNIFYYFHLHQFFSWSAGLLIFLMNCWYVYLVLYYSRRSKSVVFVAVA